MTALTAPLLPISTPAARWTLGALPGEIRAAAAAWRELTGAAGRTQAGVAPAADKLAGQWECGAHDLYQGHQEQLSRDVDYFGTTSAGVANALDQAAGILEQAGDRLAVLLHEAQGLAHLSIGAGQLTFQPHDSPSGARIEALAVEADAIRAGADRALCDVIPAINAGLESLSGLEKTWSPPPADLSLGGTINFTKPGKGGKRRRPDDEWDWVVQPRPQPPPRPGPVIRPLPPEDGEPDKLTSHFLLGPLGPLFAFNTTRNPPGPIIEQPRPPGDSPDWPFWPGEYPGGPKNPPGPVIVEPPAPGAPPEDPVPQDPPGPGIEMPRAPGDSPDWPYPPGYYPGTRPPDPDPDPGEALPA